MSRPKNCRRVSSRPIISGFKPFGIPFSEIEEILLQYDEYEAIKLLDYEGLLQEEAAERMNVSRPTLTRIYTKARQKVAKAFVEGKALLIEGGNVEFCKRGKGKGRCYRQGLGQRLVNEEVKQIKNDNMKIAITSENKSLDSLIDSRFGRCAYFAIYDTETKETEFFENSAKDSAEGAGPAAVKFIASKGAKKVVAPKFGGKAEALLNELGIEVLTLDGKTIAEVIQSIG